jgi:NodT family efflux transporter outer membrane factor (OMF) lipoprotein
MSRRLPMRGGRFAALAAGAACTVAPPPRETVPLHEPPPADWSTVPAATGVIPERWWTGFGDRHLDACVERAFARNFDLAAAAARVEQALAVATIVGAAAEPQIDVGLGIQRARRNFLGFPFAGSAGGVLNNTTTTYGLSVNLSWEIDLWGRLRAGESAAGADVQAAGADFAGAQLSLVGQLCKAWFAVVEARQQLVLAEATVQSFASTTADVRDRYRRGVRPALDAHQAETTLATARANRELRRELLERALRQLDVLVGDHAAGRTTTSDALPAAVPEVPAGLPSALLERRPDLLAAERRLAAAGCRTEVAKAALLPRLSLTGTGGTASLELEDLADTDFRVWSLGVNLLQPLFQGGALRAEVRRTEAVRAEQAALYAGLALRAFAEVEEALAAEALLEQRERALQDAATNARAAAELALERYRLGLTDFLAVADGQRSSFLADAAVIDVRRLRIENRIDLFLALGGGFGNPDAETAP